DVLILQDIDPDFSVPKITFSPKVLLIIEDLYSVSVQNKELNIINEIWKLSPTSQDEIDAKLILNQYLSINYTQNTFPCYGSHSSPDLISIPDFNAFNSGPMDYTNINSTPTH